MTPGLTIKHSGRAALIVSDIRIYRAFGKNVKPEPSGPYEMARTIWDTGAHHSVVSQSIAGKLGLEPAGKGEVYFVDGRKGEVPLAWANFVIAPGILIFNLPVQIREIPFEYQAIIGMDVITYGDFRIVTQEGKTSFSFRLIPGKNGGPKR